MRTKLTSIPALMIMLGALLPGTEAFGFGKDDAGTSGGEFLKLGADARGAGLGSAMAAASDDASAVYWNPAGLSQVTQHQLNFTGAQLYQSMAYGFMVYARPIKALVAPRRRFLRPSGMGTLALGALYLDAGTMQEMDNTGHPTGGKVTPRDLAVMAGWGASITNLLDIGLTLKYIDSHIQATARTGTADVGMRLRMHLADWPYVIAVSGHNLFGRLKFRSQEDPLPMSVRLGQSLKPLPYWTLTGDFVVPRDNAPYPNLGTEFTVPIQDHTAIFLRGGWSGRTNSADLDGVTGIAFGMGFRLKVFGIDYGWAPYGVLGNTHRFSVTFQF
ncbi:MAG: hypothetical protein A2X36_10020 [Elusimicrobia bacterium GWA2_69_24]|nr:MAG: hypothetical protein A2X36_10020 [Elusimicrobia bacterium GWA2_69_24]HBL17562.1 hypothetical protein [Elusimicrobiota bacterium]